MSDAETDTPDASIDDQPAPPDTAELEAQIELLEAENQRLRTAVAAAKRSSYRRAAAGLALLGVLALLGGIVFPASQGVLFALGGTGLFAGLLTYYLTPERFIPASVGERVYAALADTLADAVAELGLADHRIYVPREAGVRLYIPQRETERIPEADALDATFVIGDEPGERGVATKPTGRHLYAEFREAQSGPPPTTATEAATQLRDGLLDMFEFGDAAEIDLDRDDAGGRLTLELTAPVYGPGDRFDYPAVSFVAVGLAETLDTPIRTEVTQAEPVVATFRWDD